MHTQELPRFSYESILNITAKEEDTIQWCMEIGLMEKTMLCSCNENPMHLDIKRKHWRCGNGLCRKSKSIRTNSIFSQSNLPIRKIVRLLCCWCTHTSITNAAGIVGVNINSVGKWYKICRELCVEAMATHPMQVGGVGHVVEIDETSLKKKSKYGKGKKYPDEWLFGGVDRTTGKWFGVLTHGDRTKKTLSLLIKKHILPGYVYYLFYYIY